MHIYILAVSTLATVIISGVTFAQTSKAEEDHLDHHSGINAPFESVPTPESTPSAKAFTQQMIAMQDMHKKMQVAKTPTERIKLIDDQKRIMQSSIAMMGQMRVGTSGMAGMSGMSDSTIGGMETMPPCAQDSSGQSQVDNNSGMPNMGCMGDIMSMHMQMERRMAMMEQMMQMMVDSEICVPRK